MCAIKNVLHSITLTTYNLLYYNILAKILPSYLGIILDKILGSSWQDLGENLAGIILASWASSWQVLGKFLASSWQVLGKFLASSWQESCPRIRCWVCTWDNCALSSIKKVCPGQLTVLTWLLFIKYPIHDFVRISLHVFIFCTF